MGVLLAALLLAGCETTAPTPTARTPESGPRPATQRDDPRELERRAATATNPDPLLLRAAELYLDSRATADALRVLEQTHPDRLTAAQAANRQLLIARLMLQQGDPGAALERVRNAQRMVEGGLDPKARLIAADVRIEALERLGRSFEAALVRLERNPYLDGEARTANEDAIWAALGRVSAWELQQLIDDGTLGDDARGWLELAAIMQTTSSSRRAARAQLADWQARWPRHGAARFIPVMVNPARTAPDHVAVVLPLTGPLAPAGRAVRDGIVAAWLHDSEQGDMAIESKRLANPFAPPPVNRAAGQRVRLDFIDSQRNGVAVALSEAERRGAQLVIGPLTKEAVAEAAGLHRSVPVLALNYLSDMDAAASARPHSGSASGQPVLMQFGLLAEDESRTLAERALRDLRHADGSGPRALLLAAAPGWATRITDDLEARWAAGGGQIVARADLVDVRETDALVRQVLQIDASQARADRIAALIGKRPEFSPRRRQDIDAVLLVAPPTLARVAAATLAYNFANDLPVYATSHVYAGADADPSVDLDGVRFCDIPWRLLDSDLRQSIERHAPGARGTQGALYALGIDAWRLHDRLDLLADGVRLFGATGLIGLDTGTRIQRELMWAVFRDGRPVPIPVITRIAQ